LGLSYITVKPIFFKGFLVFRFELRSLVKVNKSRLVEKLGYYNADNSLRFLALNIERLGYLLNNGVFIKRPEKFVKYVVGFFMLTLKKKI